MTRFIDIGVAYKIHHAIIARAKTKADVRDFALLHSAVERPKATYGEKFLYPTLFAKAAALLQSLCLNHAFSDGNKRTAWGVTKSFLNINGYHLLSTPHEAADFIVYVDNHHPDIHEILKWLKEHSKKLA
ncbi:MAG: prophage maintenance system killer protein, death on curing protein [Microgenomates group bacterium GW2011_GWC1_43_11]|nr:MAG: prophage maintenance system killer protein, death on curing protein [Microgenomates group bacterium GW2011_GWC1_43_11]